MPASDLASQISFNPTMVRLLLLSFVPIFVKFKVSIPQWCDCCHGNFIGSVTLATVSIPQWCDCCSYINSNSLGISCFNPTMVRLLQLNDGTPSARQHCFNPTMVRLLRQQRHQTQFPIHVSIPQWCDCCSTSWIVGLRFMSFQSHNGAIAAVKIVNHPDRAERFNPTMVRLLLGHATE